MADWIIVVDDDVTNLKMAGHILSNANMRVTALKSGQALLDYVAGNGTPDLILLDIMMPEMDGISALAKIREINNVPVILLTAKSEDTDKVLGLNVGADDYVTKPFNPVELCARVRSQLRRYMQLGGGKADDGALTIGPISLDEKAKEVRRDGETVALTPTEYEILRFLMRHAGEVFPPRELYRRVWNGEPYGAENTVSVHIRHIREKLELDPAEPRWIKAVWGQGYKFERSGK